MSTQDEPKNLRQHAGQPIAYGYFIESKPNQGLDWRLADILRPIRTHWLKILAASICGLILGLLLYLWLPKFYTSTVTVVASTQSESGGPSALFQQLAGAASLAGLSLPGSQSDAELALAYLESQDLTRKFIEENHLLPVLFQSQWNSTSQDWDTDDPPSSSDGVELFERKIRRIIRRRNSNLIDVEVTWTDPKFASEWANSLVRAVNSHMRTIAIDEANRNIEYLNKELETTKVVEVRQSLYGLMETHINSKMLANVLEDYALKIVDPAVPSDKDKQVRPKILALAIVGAIVGLLFASILAVGGVLGRTETGQ